MNRLVAIVGVDKIDYLAADRELIGSEWISYLTNNKIKFSIRLKVNTRSNRQPGGTAPVKHFFRSLPIKRAMQLKDKRHRWGHQL